MTFIRMEARTSMLKCTQKSHITFTFNIEKWNCRYTIDLKNSMFASRGH